MAVTIYKSCHAYKPKGCINVMASLALCLIHIVRFQHLTAEPITFREKLRG